MANSTRQSNYELLRILSMLMIILLHTLGHGGALGSLNIYSLNFDAAAFMESASIVAVNCYILIAGYFSLNNTVRLKKVVRLYLQMLFYSILISAVFWRFHGVKLDYVFLLRTFFPLITQLWWFLTIYFVLYMLSPYINKLLGCLEKKEFIKFIGIMIVIFILWPSVSFVFWNKPDLMGNIRPINTDSGYGLYNFILLYVIGAYIRRFGDSDIKFAKTKYFTVYIGTVVLLSAINIAYSRYKGSFTGIYDYNFIFPFAASIALFLFFGKLQIKSRLINRVASLTLGIYLIHDHPLVRGFVYKFLKYSSHFNSKVFVVYTILTVLVIFISASVIELLRQYLFEKMLLNIEKIKGRTSGIESIPYES